MHKRPTIFNGDMGKERAVTDIQKLKELAENCAGKEFEFIHQNRLNGPGSGEIHIDGRSAIYCLNRAVGGSYMTNKILSFIAASNPAAILELIARLEAAEATIRQQDELLSSYQQTILKQTGAIDAFAELEKHEPEYFYRQRSDGGREGPLHESETDDVRKKSWTPLYTAPPVVALRLPVDGLPDVSEESQEYRTGFAMGCACYAKRIVEMNSTPPAAPVVLPDEIVGWVREEDGDSRDPIFLCGTIKPLSDGKAYNSTYFPVKRLNGMEG